MNKDWFEIWFNTGYHDLLYQHRDETEAGNFIAELLEYLNPPAGAVILDAACGKGRHAVILANNGYDVTGIDLSFKNISEACRYENTHLAFFRHDMRHIFRINYFDLIFNFYTSFGYFESEREHIQTMQAFSSGLKKGGRLIIDFFNLNRVLQQLVEDESKIINGIEFRISKDFKDGYLFKEITVVDKGMVKTYYEKVRGLELPDFKKYFLLSHLKLKDVFGDYHLNGYDEKNSERMILIAEK